MWLARSAGLLILLAAPVMAQPAAVTERHVPAPPRGVAGTVVSMSEQQVILRQADGKTITVLMTPRWTVSKPRKASIAELRLGDFIGSANVDLGPDKGRANELRIFEPGYRPEYGTHSIAAPGTSMTHGFVFGIAKREGGTDLDIAYPEGRRAILVPGEMGVTVSDLQPRSAAARAKVTAVTRPGSDGVHRASRLVLAGN